jgi:magnesium transporter
MSRRLKRFKPRFKRRSKPGTSPGTLQRIVDSPQPEITVIAYTPERIVETKIKSVHEIDPLLKSNNVVWINVDGLGATEILEKLGARFALHPLALEDVLNLHQRPKIEAYGETLFMVARMIYLKEHIETEQISFFLGANFVLTFQERVGDCLDAVRERIRQGLGRIRKSGADYLLYALIDTIVDSYYPVVDQFADRLEELEEQVEISQGSNAMAQIHETRNELLMVRRAIRPHREALNQLVRDEHPLVTAETRIFFRDCYDHTIQLIDLLETYREMCSDLRDYALSIVSHRMNEVMKVLTIIATIFIPLSFIAGVYGMNFDTDSKWNMPELEWTYGYPFALVLMSTVTGLFVFYFWRKGWMRTEN